MKTAYLKTRVLAERLERYGLSYAETATLRRAEMTLHRWNELECGDGNEAASFSIERDETTGKPFRCVYPYNGPSKKYPIADREAGALRRIKAVIDAHPGLWFYHQGDPRGCALYVGATSDINPDRPLDCQYTNGVAVCD